MKASEIKFTVFHDKFPRIATTSLNKWLADHPNVEILDFQYQQSADGVNSVCIMYKEQQ